MKIDSLVSIIVPVYNVEKYLEKCASSIFSQTYSNIELIAVDDGSTDGSGRILDELALLDKRMRVFHIQNGGVSNARNFGIGKAIGSWIFFSDADDYLEPDCIEKLVSAAERNRTDVVVGNCFLVIENTNERKKKEYYTDEIATDNVAAIHKVFLTSAVVWGKLYKKNFVERVRFNPAYRIGEDGLVLLELLQEGKICFISDAVYNYLIRSESVTNAWVSDKFFEGIESSIELHKRMLEFDGRLKELADYRVLRSVLIIDEKIKSLGADKKRYLEIRKKLKGYIEERFRLFVPNQYIGIKNHLKLAKILIFTRNTIINGEERL